MLWIKCRNQFVHHRSLVFRVAPRPQENVQVQWQGFYSTMPSLHLHNNLLDNFISRTNRHLVNISSNSVHRSKHRHHLRILIIPPAPLLSKTIVLLEGNHSASRTSPLRILWEVQGEQEKMWMRMMLMMQSIMIHQTFEYKRILVK